MTDTNYHIDPSMIGEIFMSVEEFADLDVLDIYRKELNWWFIDDGVNHAVMNGREAVITFLGIQMMKRLDVKPTVAFTFAGMRMDSKTINVYNTKLLTYVNEQMGSYEQGADEELIWEAYQSLYLFINDLYNFYVARLQRYCGTISGYDLYELFLDKDISEIRDRLKVRAEKEDIDQAYEDVRKETVAPRFAKNNLAKFVRNKSLDNKVTDQILVCRGRAPDIDSSVFPIAIIDSFGGGMSKAVYTMLESRLGAMSALYQEDPLKKTEYGNRCFQLNGAYVSTVIRNADCGSTVLQSAMLTEKNGSTYLGKMYETEQGELRIFDENALEERVGTILKFRSLGDCLLKKSGHVCEACYGILARHVPPGTNLGHYVNAIVFQIISQLVLSVKHVLGSASYSIFEPESHMARSIMDVDTGALRIKLKKDKAYNLTGVTIPQFYARQLPELDKISDVYGLSNKEISAFGSCVFNFDNEKTDGFALRVANDDTCSHFTYEFLDYMKKHNWEVLTDGRVYVSLNDWDFDKPVFEIPMRNPNMLDFFHTVKSILTMKESKKSKRTDSLTNLRIKTVTDCNTFQEAVTLFSTTLAERNIHVNVAMVETIIKAFTYRDVNDWRVGRAGTFNTVGYTALMANRSFPAFMALEDSHSKLNRPSTFLNDKRPTHYAENFID